MSTIALKVEGLSKLYRIGEIGTGTLAHDLNRWWALKWGKEDPFSKVGELNDRTITGNSDYVWALKNINFEVEQGEILGIIGANGAGKSTLLKILSKVTNPTKGQIKIKGRIASLLEVGTGFHPELTGRENIFLNGAILGMTKREIKSKFDEIVDFAGVERYIDTPVKRYSSGMYVRLAFAVAAFLEPEILIIDEVLAVGDVEFQKKCLGRIKDVSANDGRTVLFVSHDLAAMSVLTQRAVLLNKGEIEFIGGTQMAINKYLLSNHNKKFTFIREPNFITPTITKVMVKTSEPNNVHAIGKPLYIHCDVHIPRDCVGTSISIQIFNIKGNSVVYAWLFDNEEIQICRTTGVHKLVCELPNCSLYKGSYYIRVNLANNKTREYFEGVDNVCHFNVEMLNYEIIDWAWQDDICAYLEKFNWYKNDTKIVQG